KLARLQPLDVPGVEVLVRDDAEDADVAVARLVAAVRLRSLDPREPRQVAARRDQRGARAVLETAAAVLDGVEEEDIAIERRLRVAVPEAKLGRGDARDRRREGVPGEGPRRAGEP